MASGALAPELPLARETLAAAHPPESGIPDGHPAKVVVLSGPAGGSPQRRPAGAAEDHKGNADHMRRVAHPVGEAHRTALRHAPSMWNDTLMCDHATGQRRQRGGAGRKGGSAGGGLGADRRGDAGGGGGVASGAGGGAGRAGDTGGTRREVRREVECGAGGAGGEADRRRPRRLRRGGQQACRGRRTCRPCRGPTGGERR